MTTWTEGQAWPRPTLCSTNIITLLETLERLCIVSQHGTGREFVTEALENAMAVLQRHSFSNVGDVLANLKAALAVLEAPGDLDQRGRFGKDYPS